MKNIMFALAAATIALAGSSAFAGPKLEQPLWTCALTFSAAGGGFQVLIGHYKMSGPGEINCVDIAGNTEKLPVTVSFGTSPVAANLALAQFQMVGLATGIGVATGPQALLGKYYTVSAQGAFAVGASANLAVRGGAEVATLNVGLGLIAGAGAQLGFTKMRIEARK